MAKVTKKLFVRWFILFYVLAFAIIAYLSHNHEFLYYSLIYLLLLLFVYVIQRKYRFSLQLPGTLLLGFALFAFAHFAGGLFSVHGTKLYDLSFGFLHYDNLVHAFGAFLVTIASFNLIFPYLHDTIRSRRLYLLVLLVFISLGIGSLNENLEFSAVLFLKYTGVGNYFNNAWDLVYNLIGSLVACLVITIFLLNKKLLKIESL
ncbi:MAG: hypothetical protein V1837_08300 [Candidatus Woesearchaeota archaeon]